MTLSGYRELPISTLEAAEMWGKMQPLHLRSITVGPLLIAPSEVLQASFVLLPVLPIVGQCPGTHRICSIYYVLLTS